MPTSRRLLLALALCLTFAVTFLAAPPRAQAVIGRCGNEWFYYSDSTHTTEVGYEVYDCNCNHYFWGTRTVYSVINSLGC
ncbi:MAG TPA: hypothetical protein VFR03_11685 [Thermoanaerobaculia bacterium]|nr:hypothetical protein [Thermoanaerobaculia bacterium]